MAEEFGPDAKKSKTNTSWLQKYSHNLPLIFMRKLLSKRKILNK
jgi:hypothetical protein